MESDWTKFRALIPVVRDRYLEMRNAELVRLLTNAQKGPTERFWDAAEAVEKESKVLRRCLDDISRARMCAILVEMRRGGMLRDEDLAEFSVELRERVLGFPL